MWKLVDVQIIYKKLYQRELVTSDWFFVIRNSSGVQIFRNDEKARQRHLPKMYTLVVTMNWNRFRKMFRIRFCIFYNRSELTQCFRGIRLVQSATEACYFNVKKNRLISVCFMWQNMIKRKQIIPVYGQNLMIFCTFSTFLITNSQRLCW